MSDPLLSYNDQLGREGYFCDLCGHESNGPNGIKRFESITTGERINICVSECLINTGVEAINE